MHDTKNTDVLSASAIKNKITGSKLWHDIAVLAETASTNAEARGLAQSGISEGAVVIADHQTAGRGRLGRNWISKPGENILMSLVLRPEIERSRMFYLTAIASLAVVNAVKLRTGLSTLIKWPNDVYASGKKLAGILSEAAAHGYCVIGIGLNVNLNTDEIPEIKDIAASLQSETGRPVSRNDLIASILNETETLYQLLKDNQYDYILGQWKAHSMILGREVALISGNSIEYGLAEDLADDGSLILVKGSGERKRVAAGDVSLRIKK